MNFQVSITALRWKNIKEVFEKKKIEWDQTKPLYFAYLISIGPDTRIEVSSWNKWIEMIKVEIIWNATVRIDKPAIVSRFLQYETSFLKAKQSKSKWKAETMKVVSNR